MLTGYSRKTYNEKSPPQKVEDFQDNKIGFVFFSLSATFHTKMKNIFVSKYNEFKH